MPTTKFETTVAGTINSSEGGMGFIKREILRILQILYTESTRHQ